MYQINHNYTKQYDTKQDSFRYDFHRFYNILKRKGAEHKICPAPFFTFHMQTITSSLARSSFAAICTDFLCDDCSACPIAIFPEERDKSYFSFFFLSCVKICREIYPDTLPCAERCQCGSRLARQIVIMDFRNCNENSVFRTTPKPICSY